MQHKQKCILLVDDNPINLQIGKYILSEKYEVATALSAEQMFYYLECNTPDIILLDVEMPGINGFEAIQILKTRDKSKYIPVIFLTSNSAVDDRLKGMSLGAVDYVIKPYLPQFLFERIAAAWGILPMC